MQGAGVLIATLMFRTFCAFFLFVWFRPFGTSINKFIILLLLLNGVWGAPKLGCAYTSLSATQPMSLVMVKFFLLPGGRVLTVARRVTRRVEKGGYPSLNPH